MGQPPSSLAKPQSHPRSSGTAHTRYRLYRDESGDHVFQDEHAMAQPAHMFLALCGCFSQADHYVTFHDEWESPERRHFPYSPDEPILLHRSDIINRRGPFKRLKEPDADRPFNEDMPPVERLVKLTT